MHGKKILVVEDDKAMLETLASLISNFGASVSTAQSGNAAFEKMKLENYDIVMTDIRMPDGDGVTLLRNINSFFSNPPFLFVCSGYNDLSPDTFQNLGVQGVFEKPIKLNQLIEKMCQCFNE